MMKKWIVGCVLVLSACTGIPEGITPVGDLDIDRYLGTWYEIARLDHSFERGLEKVTAQYTRREDGGIRVINRGFNPKNGKWKEVVGKAYFMADDRTGRLKVSFWGPFYASYNIFYLDQENYAYALVCGPDKSYLWLLARQPKMEASRMAKLIEKAENLGFDTQKLIYVNQ